MSKRPQRSTDKMSAQTRLHTDGSLLKASASPNRLISTERNFCVGSEADNVEYVLANIDADRG